MKTLLIIVGILLILFIIKAMMKMAWRVFWLLAIIAVGVYLWAKFL